VRGWLAAAEIHRLHHRKQAILGDVNFGLFTTLWDRVLGTYRDCTGERPVRAGAIGIGAEPEYPSGYLAQLRKPFVRTASR